MELSGNHVVLNPGSNQAVDLEVCTRIRELPDESVELFEIRAGSEPEEPEETHEKADAERRCSSERVLVTGEVPHLESYEEDQPGNE